MRFGLILNDGLLSRRRFLRLDLLRLKILNELGLLSDLGLRRFLLRFSRLRLNRSRFRLNLFYWFFLDYGFSPLSSRVSRRCRIRRFPCRFGFNYRLGFNHRFGFRSSFLHLYLNLFSRSSFLLFGWLLSSLCRFLSWFLRSSLLYWLLFDRLFLLCGFLNRLLCGFGSLRFLWFRWGCRLSSPGRSLLHLRCCLLGHRGVRSDCI